MHELSLAQSIVEIVRQNVPIDQRTCVKSVKLRVGDLAGVVADSLEFCFSAITAESELSDTTLQIERVPFTLLCKNCNSTFASEFGVVLCPTCGNTNTQVVCGTEMHVVEIELREPIVAEQ
jgi:hydrogenase nickel incorporation protein HypA/HybF